MIVAMSLMMTALRSALGGLAIVAGLWVVALVRARAARTSVAAREFLLDLMAMAIAIIVPLLHGSTSSMSMQSMAVAAGTPFDGRVAAAVLVLGWAGARYALIRLPTARGGRLRSVVSGSCCAVGLVAMLVM
jgi:hypothetical protein